MIALSRNTDTATINKILTVPFFPSFSFVWPSLILVSDIHLACNQGFMDALLLSYLEEVLHMRKCPILVAERTNCEEN